MRKKIIWASISAALLVAIVAIFWWKQSAPAPRWRTAKVERGPIQVSVTATGTLQAVVTVQVGTQVSGTIAALYADFNTHVKKGQVIARLDTTLLHAALEDARSSVSRTHAQERRATEAWKRSQTLFDRALVSQAELDQARADAEVASATLTSARAGLERAEINLGYASIVSPIDGIVLHRAVDVGQTVAASFSTPTLFVIAGDLREMQVQASVDEADIGRIREVQKVIFTVDAYPDTQFDGTVKQIRLQAKTEQNVVTYDVVIRVPNPDLKLMPGMTANLSIAVARKENALLVPAAALRFQPQRGKAAETDSTDIVRDGSGPDGRVFLMEHGALKSVRVRTGLSDGNKTEVEGPLQAGSLVVVGRERSMGEKSGNGTPFGMPTGGVRRRM